MKRAVTSLAACSLLVCGHAAIDANNPGGGGGAVAAAANDAAAPAAAGGGGGGGGGAGTGSVAAIQQSLQAVSERLSLKYNMSIAVAFTQGLEAEPTLKAAAGFTDAGLGIGTPTRPADPDDLYVWGSITKMFTAPLVLQLVEKGVVGSLDDPVAPYINTFLHENGAQSLEEHFGPEISNVTVRHLLHMESGISDYDGESYARDQFANRSRDFSPLEILADYVSGTFRFAPGSRQSYCSTNYILLGMLLAQAHNQSDWTALAQRMVFPSGTNASSTGFNRSDFADAGTCEDWTPVHGILEGYSTASIPKQDVWNVSCVGGWTAGNYIGSVSDVAEFTFDLYGPSHSVVNESSLEQMIDFGQGSFYGMGTFNLGWSISNHGEKAYGHVGDTYGYQSQTTFVPNGANPFVISVATNVETNSQAQPAEATCLLVNAIQAIQSGKPVPNCTFVVPHRFIGTCTCE